MKVHHIKVEAKQNQIEMSNQVETAKKDVYSKLKQVQKHLKTVSETLVILARHSRPSYWWVGVTCISPTHPVHGQ